MAHEGSIVQSATLFRRRHVAPCGATIRGPDIMNRFVIMFLSLSLSLSLSARASEGVSRTLSARVQHSHAPTRADETEPGKGQTHQTHEQPIQQPHSTSPGARATHAD